MSQKKVALVIGAGSSLGSAIARVFASDNYTTVVARRNGNELGPLKEEIESKGGCLLYTSPSPRDQRGSSKPE